MKMINPLLVARILSTILLIESLTFLLCIPAALFYRESVLPFILSTAATLLLWSLLRVLGRNSDVTKASNRDTYLAVTLAWIFLALMGSLPYLLSGTIQSPVNAIFESASGFTTTGASILTDVEVLPYSILFWRSLTHWIGGIGIIVLVIIILPSLKVTGYQLFSLESSLREKIHSKARGVAVRMGIIYLGLTLAETLLLVMGDMTLFDSLCHSFGTVATGGFSTRNNSLQFYSSYSQYIVMIFMFLSGTSMLIYYYLAKRSFSKIKHNEELRFYVGVVFTAGMVATIILLPHSKGFWEAFRNGFFQVVSIITCTGFASDDYILWPSAGMMLIFLLLFAGGSTGSTSGGIKMARHLVMLKNIKRTFTRLNHPKALVTMKLNGKVINENTNNSIVSFVLIYIFIFIIGTSVLALAGSDPVTSASSVATCMAGIGPGLGTVGPMSNFSAIPEISKVVLSLLMIIGRLEIITVFTLFTRSFWTL
jgi:trk system potassium uptake protein TrkH